LLILYYDLTIELLSVNKVTTHALILQYHIGKLSKFLFGETLMGLISPLFFFFVMD